MVDGVCGGKPPHPQKDSEAKSPRSGRFTQGETRATRSSRSSHGDAKAPRSDRSSHGDAKALRSGRFTGTGAERLRWKKARRRFKKLVISVSGSETRIRVFQRRGIANGASPKDCIFWTWGKSESPAQAPFHQSLTRTAKPKPHAVAVSREPKPSASSGGKSEVEVQKARDKRERQRNANPCLSEEGDC
jgi:hypothetical protein